MHIDAFKINGTTVTLNDEEYSEKYTSVEYSQQTEAGTTHRDTVRVGFLSALNIKITTVGAVKAIFDSAVKQDSLTLTIYSDSEAAPISWVCFISDYSASLVRDTLGETYWNIQATFSDLEAA